VVKAGLTYDVKQQKKDWVLVSIEFAKVEDHLVGAVGQRRDACT
jgi:uncharacterized protein YqjF (DUF2071 family)